jgi:outer membrane receptor protein involved in Fe transport
MLKSLTFVLLTLFVFSISSIQSAKAQETGFIRGNVIDGDEGVPLYGATVRIKELPGVGTISDFDGNYSISLAPGFYTVEVSFVSFQAQVFTDVEVKAKETTIIDVVLETKTTAVVEIIYDTRRQDSDVSILLERKNAPVVSDGLSAQSFRKVGDSDLSGAMKRVTGVTIQGGKNVFVRGLGDRYTITTLNGMMIPGLDPDGNAVQMDIFPTAVLENVSVYKTFSPNLYGDFTGGMVDVVTKKFPDFKTTQIGFGLGFTPGMTFNNNFILYKRGRFDWAGFDDGSRGLNFNPRAKIPDEVMADPYLEDVTRSFNSQLGAISRTALPNGSFSIYHGNQIDLKNKWKFGYNAVLNYSNEHIFYTDYQSNDYLKDTDRCKYDMLPNVLRIGNVGRNNTMLSTLLSGSIKSQRSTITATIFAVQNGESTAAQRVNQDLNQNQATLIEDVLTYTARTLSSFLLGGTHKFKGFDMEWTNAFSYSRVYDPDFRETRISVTDGDTTLSTGNGSGIDRFWRDLNEFNQNFKVDFIIPVGKNKKAQFRTGAFAALKFRDFEVYSFKHRRTDLNNIELDPNWFLQDDQIWSADPNDPNYRYGTYTIGNYQPANNYSARQNVFSVYAMTQHTVFEKLKLVYGLRLEKVDMFYTGETNAGDVVYRDQNTMDELNILPSVNVVFALNDKTNFRAGFNQTVARPSFREKSIAQIYDPITKRTFIGNIDLNQTNIMNYDIRYEFFLSPREIFSVSAFYKQFDGHIENVAFPQQPDNIKPRNSGDADLFGVEIEFKKALADKDKHEVLSRFFFNMNASFVRARVNLNDVLVDGQQTEFELREINKRDGETISQFRPMTGQSPYSINAGISYEIPESQTNVSLAYNVQGEQLTIIGSGRVPDVYTIPFHSLNFNAYRNFGKKDRSRLTLTVSNILNDDISMVYRSYGTSDVFFNTYKPGVGINMKYVFTF